LSAFAAARLISCGVGCMGCMMSLALSTCLFCFETWVICFLMAAPEGRLSGSCGVSHDMNATLRRIPCSTYPGST
jgi:hypothetical protein